MRIMADGPVILNEGFCVFSFPPDRLQNDTSDMSWSSQSQPSKSSCSFSRDTVKLVGRIVTRMKNQRISHPKVSAMNTEPTTKALSEQVYINL